MPAAAPLPRRPAMLIMDGAAGLLTAPGCPVCRYAGEASDRYLSWFALEGHYDATVMDRLVASLGMCACHTRALMRQPGAAVRLTAVYLYVLRAASERLAGRAAPMPECPMCEHREAAVGRALETVLEGLAEEPFRQRCRALGGLCLPHLNAAAQAADRGTIAWLTDTVTATLISRAPGAAWMAGDSGHDADARAVLGRATPAEAMPGSYVCTACLAAARAERAGVAGVVDLRAANLPADAGLVLCAGHLGDAAALAGRGPELATLLRWQATCQLAARSGRQAPASRSRASVISRKLRRSRGQSRQQECAVCQTRNAATRHALDCVRQRLRTSAAAQDQPEPLCVRHVLRLHAIDPWAGQVTSRHAVDAAETLIAELAEAFRKNTWNYRHEAAGTGSAGTGSAGTGSAGTGSAGTGSAGTEATAWRRAAAFLDGGVFCGGPPR
jgi:hypothetical protein